MNKCAPIRLSIYYSRQAWPGLLKNCLTPLIQELKTTGICNEYALYFCEEQGEHLRLILHLTSADPQEILPYQATIETFLAAHPTQMITKQLPLHDAFFLDFPNNSIYINIFRPYSSHTAQLNFQQVALIRKEISALMLDAFADDMISQESLFNFYLCLKIVALAVFDNPLNAAKELQTGYEKLTNLLPTADLIHLEYEADNLIKSNCDDLNEMVALIAQGDYTADTEWLAAWLQTCREVSATKESINAFWDITLLVRQHINFHHTKWSALSLIIVNRLLSNQNKLISNKI